MANDLRGRPWIVDTVGLVKAGKTFTTGFVFEGYGGGAGSQAILKDGKRNRNICVLNGVASGASQGEGWLTLHPPTVIEDLTVVALDSGYIKVLVV